MLKFISKCNVDYENMRQLYLPPHDMTRFMFDSARKRMSTILSLKPADETEHGYPKRLHVKGASEIILETCAFYLNDAGEKVPLEDIMK
jgi:Ca2+ transporting ATPase